MPSIRQAPPHPVDLHVGRRVAERRMTLKFSQTDLSRALGITFQQVQKYEKGDNRISASKLWATAAFLGVDIGYFFEGLTRGSNTDVLTAQTLPADSAASRQSIELTRLAAGLNTRQQRLMVSLMREMTGEPPDSQGPNTARAPIQPPTVL